MSNIDKQALREAAERAIHDDWGYGTDIFHEQVTPSVVLALLDECAALAAENTGLKAAKEIIRHLNVNREEANFCGIDDCYIDDAVAAMITPATDAFLAEVRASELDSLAGVAETMLVKFSNQLCSSDMHEVVGWKMVLQQATNRAAQLRKGGAA